MKPLPECLIIRLLYMYVALVIRVCLRLYKLLPDHRLQQTQLRLGQVTGTRLFEALPDFCTVFFDPHPLF